LFAADIVKVLYAPQKAFKTIIQTPKYWGPLLVFILFIALQSAFYYNFYSKTNYEQTSPNINSLGNWTQNATLWTFSSGVTVSSNYLDFMNSTLYGNSSLQFDGSNAGSISMEISTFENVDCGPSGFSSLSLRVKQVDPQSAPTSATLTLFSLTTANTFEYDLTKAFSNASLIGIWNNLTIPVGANASNWQVNGSPQWQNITGLKLDFNFPASSNISLRLQGLFFRGSFLSPVKTDFGGFVIYVLQLVVTQFLFQWLLFTGIMYIVIKGLKGTIVWKPLFVAVGFALAVTLIQSIINSFALLTLPAISYPVEVLTRLPVEADSLANAISVQAGTYTLIASVFQLITYVWIVALGTIIVRTLQPEFAWLKCIAASAVGFIVTVLLMSILGV
jgi:hypothetical protein